MANFTSVSVPAGAGYDATTKTLTLPLSNRRVVALWGSGRMGMKLDVSAKDPGIVDVTEPGFTRDGSAFPSDTRQFWIDGLQVGSTTVRAHQMLGKNWDEITVNVTSSTDIGIMSVAFAASRAAVAIAIVKLGDLIGAMAAGSTLNADQVKVSNAVTKWLNVPAYVPGSPDVASTVGFIARAMGLYSQNLALKNSKRSALLMFRTPDGFHGNTWGNVDLGMECGDTFFSHDGPNCRRDVVTHEFMHLLGVHHGTSSLSGPTTTRTLTPDQSLDSADNLAQLTADITAGSTDCCTRVGD